MPAGQRSDARHAKSIRGVPWQQNPAEAAEGEPVSMARIVGVPMVPSEHRPVVPVVDPREYRARRFYIRREVELVKFGYAENCDGCNAAQLGAEAKAHSDGCRERIRQAMTNDGMGSRDCKKLCSVVQGQEGRCQTLQELRQSCGHDRDVRCRQCREQGFSTGGDQQPDGRSFCVEDAWSGGSGSAG